MADIYGSAKRSAIMSRVRSTGSKAENAVRTVAARLGAECEANCLDLPGKPDLVFRDAQLVVFVHGCFWHRHDCPRGRSKPKTNVAFWETKLNDNVERDMDRQARLREMGWRVRVIWECQTGDDKAIWELLERGLGHE